MLVTVCLVTRFEPRSAALALGMLSAFRWIESKMQSLQYTQFIVKFARESAMPETELRKLVKSLAFTIANLH